MQQKQGFTLLELLVVIAIIGLIATVAIVSIDRARMSSRDTARFHQALEFLKALELYHTETGYYPDAASPSTPVLLDTVHSQFSTYLSRVPLDPLFDTSETYLYCSSANLRTMTLIIRTEKTGAGTDPQLCVISRGPQAYTNICTGISGYESCAVRIQ
jgi:prepilin-type N-terminal cleavage/methylation domain-containing protein